MPTQYFQKGQSGNPEGRRAETRVQIFKKELIDACEKEDYARVREGIDKLLTFAAKGQSWAIHMIADRLDGKPAQIVVTEDEQGNRVPFRGIIELVRPHHSEVEVPGDPGNPV